MESATTTKLKVDQWTVRISTIHYGRPSSTSADRGQRTAYVKLVWNTWVWYHLRGSPYIHHACSLVRVSSPRFTLGLLWSLYTDLKLNVFHAHFCTLRPLLNSQYTCTNLPACNMKRGIADVICGIDSTIRPLHQISHGFLITPPVVTWTREIIKCYLSSWITCSLCGFSSSSLGQSLTCSFATYHICHIVLKLQKHKVTLWCITMLKLTNARPWQIEIDWKLKIEENLVLHSFRLLLDSYPPVRAGHIILLFTTFNWRWLPDKLVVTWNCQHVCINLSSIRRRGRAYSFRWIGQNCLKLKHTI